MYQIIPSAPIFSGHTATIICVSALYRAVACLFMKKSGMRKKPTIFGMKRYFFSNKYMADPKPYRLCCDLHETSKNSNRYENFSSRSSNRDEIRPEGVNRGQQIRRSVLIFRKIRQSADIFTKIRVRNTVRKVSTKNR